MWDMWKSHELANCIYIFTWDTSDETSEPHKVNAGNDIFKTLVLSLGSAEIFINTSFSRYFSMDG